MSTLIWSVRVEPSETEIVMPDVSAKCNRGDQHDRSSLDLTTERWMHLGLGCEQWSRCDCHSHCIMAKSMLCLLPDERCQASVTAEGMVVRMEELREMATVWDLWREREDRPDRAPVAALARRGFLEGGRI